jgi:hypothetical protein
MDRSFALGDAALDALGRVRTRVALHHVDALDQHAAGLAIDMQNAAGLALVLAGDDLDRIFLADLDLDQNFRRVRVTLRGFLSHC